MPSDSTPTYSAKLDAGEKDKEFLASTDPWFRPVGFCVGPDGYLYVIDMYRQHIETPFSIPEDLKKEMDFMNGSEYGRIYRILPKNAKLKTGNFPNFQKMQTSELLKFISHPNQQLRIQAQRLLLERQDKSIVPLVKEMFIQAKDPRFRLHGLYVLEGLNALDGSLVKQAITDNHPGLRECGLRLAEQYPEYLPQLIQSTNDSSIQVAFQACLSVGNFKFKQSAPTLVKVIRKYGQDPWFRAAVLSSEPGSSFAFFEMLVNQDWLAGNVKQEQIDFLEDFSNIVALRNNKDEIKRLVKILSEGDRVKKEMLYKLACFKGLIRGIKDSKNKPNADSALSNMFEDMLNDSSDNREKEAIQNLINALK
jgi:hypothetical protein